VLMIWNCYQRSI